MSFSFQNILTMLGDLGDLKMFLSAYESISDTEAIISVSKWSLFFCSMSEGHRVRFYWHFKILFISFTWL